MILLWKYEYKTELSRTENRATSAGAEFYRVSE